MRCTTTVYKTSHGCMEFFRTCCSARAVYTEEGGKFDSFSPFNQGAKRKCGLRLHWLDKRVTTSAVYFVRNRTPFLFAAAGRQSNEEKIAIMVKRLSPPSPLNFNFSKPSSTKGMKYKMKSWEIKKNYPRLKTAWIPNYGLSLCSRQLRPSCERI